MAKNKEMSAGRGDNGANLGFEDKLAELRDTLLPKLMSGEVRVRGAEKQAEAVA